MRVLNPIDGTERETVHALRGQVFGVLRPLTMGRALDFAFGAGDRTRGLYDPGTLKRPAGFKSLYDPANLYRQNYNISPGGR